MNPQIKEALTVLLNATNLLRLTRDEHAQIQGALMLLQLEIERLTNVEKSMVIKTPEEGLTVLQKDGKMLCAVCNVEIINTEAWKKQHLEYHKKPVDNIPKNPVS